MVEVRDPWSEPETPARAIARVGASRLAHVALLGVGGTALRLWGHGSEARTAAAVLVVGASLWQLLRRAPGLPSVARIASMGGVAAAVAWAVVPTVGRAPGLFTLLSLLVADAALVSWRPRPTWPGRRTAVAGLALPLIVAAQVVWFRSGSILWPLLLLATAVVVIEAYHRFPVLMEGVDRSVGRAVAAVAAMLGGAALLVLALPFFYLPSAIGRLLRVGSAGRRRHRPKPAWRPVSRPPGRTLADARLPFATPDRATARRRHLATLTLLVAVATVAGAALLWMRDDGTPEVPAAVGSGVQAGKGAEQLDLLEALPYSERPALADQDYADDLQQDLPRAVLVPHEATGYVTADTSTRHVNVRDGIRSTAPSPCESCPELRVWLVGASSVFGVGQRDDHTVASELVRLAADAGIALHVSNLAAPGWTLHQEANWVRHQLSLGAAEPHLVVFLDGFNDVSSALAKEVTGRVDDGDPLVFNEDDMVAALRTTSLLSERQMQAVIDRATHAYDAELRSIRAELTSLGIPSRAFFQPDAFASQAQIDTVRTMYRGMVPRLIDSGQLGEALEGTARRLEGTVQDLRDIISREDDPIFLDVVHTNEDGARSVAEAVMDALLQQLRRQAGSN